MHDIIIEKTTCICVYPGPWSKSDKQAQSVEEKYDQGTVPPALFQVNWSDENDFACDVKTIHCLYFCSNTLELDIVCIFPVGSMVAEWSFFFFSFFRKGEISNWLCISILTDLLENLANNCPWSHDFFSKTYL